MNYRTFERQLIPFKVFSIEDIRKKEPGFDTRRLVEWQRKGYIQKIINRWYLFSDLELTEQFLFLIANKVYAPSYISFETALAYHGLIPEAVFTIISATSKKTRTFHTSLGIFNYHHLKTALMFGYRLEAVDNQFFKIAEPEKAILDYLYLHPQIRTAEDFDAWRINADWLREELNREKMENYLVLFANKALSRRVRSLYKYLENA